MQFTVEIPDTEAQRIALAVCSRDGYTPVDIMDAVERTKTHVFRYLAGVVIEQEAAEAAVAAADAVRGNASDPLAQALFAPVVPPGPVGPEPPVEPGTTGATGATGATGSLGSLAAAVRKGRVR